MLLQIAKFSLFFLCLNSILFWASQWLSGKESACSAGAAGDTGRAPGEGTSNTSVFLSGKSLGQRSLVDYSAWDRKQLDTCLNEKQHKNKYSVLCTYTTSCLSTHLLMGI